MNGPREITIAHSPDTDDLFMFWALRTGRITHTRYRFTFETANIETLNLRAGEEVYDLTALSAAAYLGVAETYALTSSGASFAEGDYGPVLVSGIKAALSDLKGAPIAVPGVRTTSYLLLRLALPDFEPRVMPPEGILDAVASGAVAAGLLIHEGQIIYKERGLTLVHSLMETWRGVAGDLPLPLGVNAVRRSLGDAVMREIEGLQRESIRRALSERDAARDFCLMMNPGLQPEQATKYLDWYVNGRTLCLGEDGRRALEVLFGLARGAGVAGAAADII